MIKKIKTYTFDQSSKDFTSGIDLYINLNKIIEIRETVNKYYHVYIDSNITYTTDYEGLKQILGIR